MLCRYKIHGYMYICTSRMTIAGKICICVHMCVAVRVSIRMYVCVQLTAYIHI